MIPRIAKRYAKIIPSLLRINNWPKNLLVFSPLILSHNSNILLYADTLLLMFMMCLLSSSVYIFNDISDIEFDKNHILKKNRPFASNKITKSQGYIVISILLIFTLTIQFYFFNLGILSLIIVYLFFNYLFTKILRTVKYIDLLILTGFYLLRIYFGSILNNIEISLWYFAFAFLIFLFLSILKRVIELQNNGNFIYKKSYKGYNKNDTKYLIKFSDILLHFTILFLLLYYTFGIDENLYQNYQFIILPIIFIFFWMKKISTLVKNNQIKTEIINFILTDFFSYKIIFLVIVFFILST